MVGGALSGVETLVPAQSQTSQVSSTTPPHHHTTRGRHRRTDITCAAKRKRTFWRSTQTLVSAHQQPVGRASYTQPITALFIRAARRTRRVFPHQHQASLSPLLPHLLPQRHLSCLELPRPTPLRQHAPLSHRQALRRQHCKLQLLLLKACHRRPPSISCPISTSS